MTVALIDDQALGAVLRGEPPAPLAGRDLATTGCWYVRLCQAVLSATERPGVLSRPFEELAEADRRRAVNALVELPVHIELLGVRHLGPAIGRLRQRHSLNLLAGEAAAAANHLGAEVFLSAPSPMLEQALAVEGRTWARLTCGFVVVGTGVDPVTSRFSGGPGPISAGRLTSGFGAKVQVRPRYLASGE